MRLFFVCLCVCKNAIFHKKKFYKKWWCLSGDYSKLKICLRFCSDFSSTDVISSSFCFDMHKVLHWKKNGIRLGKKNKNLFEISVMVATLWKWTNKTSVILSHSSIQSYNSANFLISLKSQNYCDLRRFVRLIS